MGMSGKHKQETIKIVDMYIIYALKFRKNSTYKNHHGEGGSDVRGASHPHIDKAVMFTCHYVSA